ncbi:MAG TPA: hypothetical protein VLJ42_04230 [Solirubrobacteraceae bacterium]|nr:hypothetical protein [Solirubrobacteraceae bacterium]
MAAVPLKPEYAPTLGQLLSPRWHKASRPVQRLMLLAGVALVLGLIAIVLTLENATISRGAPVPFSFSYRQLYETAPDPGGYAKVERRADGRLEDSFAVQPLRLPPYSGSITGELPLYTVDYVRSLATRYRGFQLQGESKTRVNTVPGYNVFYTALVEGRRFFGRDILLLPDHPGVRDGVRIVMLSSPRANAQVTSPMLVATVGVLQRALHTFTFR